MDKHLLPPENPSKLCRICLDTDNPEDLIRSCLCSGSSTYVHRKCLDNWRSINKNGRAFKFCDVCQFEFVIEPVVDDPSVDRKRLLIFCLLVTRDITLFILSFQVIIIGMTFLLELADDRRHHIKYLYPLSMNSFSIYYTTSLILVLSLFGFASLCYGLITDDENGPNGCNYCYSGFYFNICHFGYIICGVGCAVILAAFLLIFLIIGLVLGAIVSVIIIRQIIKRHTNKLWLKQETKKYVVKDLEGSINELENISTEQPITASSMPIGLLSKDNIKHTIV